MGRARDAALAQRRLTRCTIADSVLDSMHGRAHRAFAGVMSDENPTPEPDPRFQTKPVLDGAEEDFSDGGSSKVEAIDLHEAGRDDEIVPPDDDHA